MEAKTLQTHDLFFEMMDRYIHELKSMTMHKVFVILCVSGVLLAIQKFVETYLFHDWSYLTSLFVLITIDTITGTMKAFKEGILSSKKFGRLFIKITLYCLALISINVLISFKINGVHPSVFDWIEVFMFSTLMFRETVSIFENITLIYPSLIPAFVMKRLEAFDGVGFNIKEEDKQEKAAEDAKK